MLYASFNPVVFRPISMLQLNIQSVILSPASIRHGYLLRVGSFQIRLRPRRMLRSDASVSCLSFCYRFEINPHGMNFFGKIVLRISLGSMEAPYLWRIITSGDIAFCLAEFVKQVVLSGSPKVTCRLLRSGAVPPLFARAKAIRRRTVKSELL